jgi:hypothetical protein
MPLAHKHALQSPSRRDGQQEEAAAILDSTFLWKLEQYFNDGVVVCASQVISLAVKEFGCKQIAGHCRRGSAAPVLARRVLVRRIHVMCKLLNLEKHYSLTATKRYFKRQLAEWITCQGTLILGGARSCAKICGPLAATRHLRDVIICSLMNRIRGFYVRSPWSACIIT